MQEIVIKDILIVNKFQFKKYIREQLITNRPELFNRIPNKLVLEGLIFIKGYAAAIEKEIRLPVIESDVQQLLFEQGLTYILAQIE